MYENIKTSWANCQDGHSTTTSICYPISFLAIDDISYTYSDGLYNRNNKGSDLFAFPFYPLAQLETHTYTPYLAIVYNRYPSSITPICH